MISPEQTAGVGVGASTKYKVVGTRPIRIDGVEKVEGKAVFGADVRLPGMLVGKVLRSPHAHARIKSIDTSEAESLPGVMAVVTSRDFEALQGEDRSHCTWAPPSLQHFRDHFLASDKVLYHGHPVAAVAAVDEYTADEALRLIRVEYEVLPPVMDLMDALKDGSPLLHEDGSGQMGSLAGSKPSNLAFQDRWVKGNPDKGFAAADVVVEREYRTETMHQGYIEPHACTASWSGDQLMVWSTTQGNFEVRAEVSRLLQYPAAKITVNPTEVGGAFGGKLFSYLDPVAAFLARKAGRPVTMRMSREEVLQATGPTPGSYMKIKIGATRDGKITAAVLDVYFEVGAYAGMGLLATGMMCALGTYEIPNCEVNGYDVYVNRPRCAPLRGPGATQTAFTVETAIDELAEQLGIDPLDLRLKNAATEGCHRVDGPVYARVGFVETMEALKAHPHYSAPLEGPNRGRGVACGWWVNQGFLSSVTLSVNPDGSVNFASGSVDLHGTRTSLAMQVAETLGIGLEQVHATMAGTDNMAYTSVTGGSRVTYATGLAAIQAAEDVIQQMRGRAAQAWSVDPGVVEFADGIFTNRLDGRQMSFREVAATLMNTGGVVTSAVSINPAGAGPSIGAHLVDVEVDPETGKVQILRYTIAQDCGRAIHPSMAEGQMQGGVGMGIGWALNEVYQYDSEGRLRNTSLLDYKMPTALDLPMIDTILVEVPNPYHPYGVRGMGETPIVGPPAAIANAIYRATGVRMRELPMTAPKILKAMGVIE